jgi:hypothetical protein
MQLSDHDAHVFDPEEISRLRLALESSWHALRFVFADATSVEARAIRESLATCIISLADTGEMNPKVLANRALANIPPLSAQWDEDAK